MNEIRLQKYNVKIYEAAKRSMIDFIKSDPAPSLDDIADFASLLVVNAYDTANEHKPKRNVKRFDFADMHTEPRDLV